MLIAGRVNPPPITDAAYVGVYLSGKDNIPAMMNALRGAPLRIEHNGNAQVGCVLQGWSDPQSGALYALAEVDVSHVPGALAAAAIEKGAFGEFSLGYTSRLQRNESTGRLEASDKRIIELSVVKTGARPDCRITHHHQQPQAPVQKPAGSGGSGGRK